uniref:Uncharacterized protein n=1 Tax=Arundo donax TaxID=35708 RepID=A0A0A9SEQ0_ARUDO
MSSYFFLVCCKHGMVLLTWY